MAAGFHLWGAANIAGSHVVSRGSRLRSRAVSDFLVRKPFVVVTSRAILAAGLDVVFTPFATHPIENHRLRALP